jgi:isoquinoline 1-oxidoreductase beta subunit
VANYSLQTSRIPFNVPVGMLRAPGDNSPVFVNQSFLDELAHAAGRDPIDFQLEMLNSPLPGEGIGKPGPQVPDFLTTRMIRIIDKVRDMSGWAQRKKLPRGTGMGFACAWSHSGYVAQVHRVSLHKGVIVPEKVWVAVDIGRHVVNPLNAENQVQGSILDALSAASGQRVTFDKGRTAQSNFHDYPLLRNINIPAIEVEFIRTDFSPTGLGEPAYTPTQPAYCNAIFAATGKRLRSLPVAEAFKNA